MPCILDGYDQSAYWMRSVALKGCLQIGLITRGSCTVVVGTQEYQLSEGSIVLVDPDNDIATTKRSRDSRYSGILFDWMQRTVQAADEAQPDRGWKPTSPELGQPGWSDILHGQVNPIVSPALARRIGSNIALAARRWWQGPIERMRANGILHHILVEIMEWHSDPLSASQHRGDEELNHRAHAWVRQHVYERPTVDELARAMGLTRSHFSRLYSRNKESGPGEFIRCIIIEQIERDIRSNIPLADIAHRFAWSSSRQLTQFVSRATNTPWSVWFKSARS